MSPKPYIRPLPNTWWLKNRTYKAYMLREFTSPFVALYTVILTVGLVRLYQGQDAYNAWLAALEGPLAIGFHLVALAMAVYHSTSWFNVAPQAMPIQIGERKVNAGLVVTLHYLVFIAVSAIVLLLASA